MPHGCVCAQLSQYGDALLCQTPQVDPTHPPTHTPQVPVGILANTAVLKALCAVGRRAAALDYLRGIPTKRQRTPMYTWLLRSCNDAGEPAQPLRQPCCVLARRCWAAAS